MAGLWWTALVLGLIALPLFVSGFLTVNAANTPDGAYVGMTVTGVGALLGVIDAVLWFIYAVIK